MSEELTPGEQQASEFVMRELAKGVSKSEIVGALVRQGWLEETAVQFVDDFVDNIERRVKGHTMFPEAQQIMDAVTRKYKHRMLYGVVLAVGGTVVTIASYSAAGATGVYVVAWGAIAFGAISFFRGLIGWLRTRMR